jgi:hypothetical protein
MDESTSEISDAPGTAIPSHLEELNEENAQAGRAHLTRHGWGRSLARDPGVPPLTCHIAARPL